MATCAAGFAQPSTAGSLWPHAASTVQQHDRALTSGSIAGVGARHCMQWGRCVRVRIAPLPNAHSMPQPPHTREGVEALSWQRGYW
jgi:hypothetical protein